MPSATMRFVLVLAIAVVACQTPTYAARCQLVTGTATGATKEVAVERSREGLEAGIADLVRRQGWRAVSVRPHATTPHPFFKDRVITRELLLKPDVRSRRAHSVCWRGVVAPAVCSSGALACGR